VADTTINFPASGGLLTGGTVEVAWPITSLRTAGSATITPFVYICDSGNHRIQVTDYDGNPLFTFGSFGSGDGEFNTPYGVANDGERVYVSDSGNNRVQYFNLLGNYLGQWGTFGTALGEFNGPMGIAVDAAYVYVIDQGNNRFQIFTKDGVCMFALGEFGSGTDQFNAPTNCYVDDVYLWIDDTGNSRVVYYLKLIAPLMYGNVVFPAFSVSAQIKSNNSHGSIMLAPFRMQTYGATMSTGRVSRGNAVFPALAMASPGAMMTTGHVMRGNVVLPAFSLSGRMTTGRIMTGNVVLPAFTLSGTARRGAVMTGNIVLPAFTLAATGYTVKPTPVFRGMAMNMRNKAITKYSGYDFNSVAILNGKLYGASSSGIHLLEGDDDNGTAIDALIRTGRFDLHSEMVRRLVDAWLTSRFTGQGIFRIYETEDDTDDVTEYDIDGEDTAIHDERIPFERGHEGRFAEFEVVNVDGCDFDIGGMTIRLHDIPKGR